MNALKHQAGLIRLKILLPTKIFLNEDVLQVAAESALGGFTLKPRHIDMATVIVPGIMSYTSKDERIVFLAVDRGVVVKRGSEVTVASHNAVRGELGMLEKEVHKMLDISDERERSARSAVARLEADFVRRILEFRP